MNHRHDDLIEELAREVRAQTAARETALTTVGLAANSSALVVLFNGVIGGHLCLAWLLVVFAIVFFVGALCAGLALLFAYWHGRDFSKLLQEIILKNRGAPPNTSGSVEGAAKQIRRMMDFPAEDAAATRIETKYGHFSTLLYVSFGCFGVGVIAAIIGVLTNGLVCAAGFSAS